MLFGLLRQPHRFVRGGSGGIRLPVGDLAVAKAEHPGRGGGHLDAAAPNRLPAARDQELVVDLLELLGKDQEALPDLLMRLPPGPDLVMPAADLAFQGRADRNPFDVGAQVSHVTLDVTAVPGLERAMHGLRVLLRHRLAREPHGFEGFGFGGIAAAASDLAVLEGEHLPGAALDARPRFLPAAPLVQADDHAVARVDGLVGLETELVDPAGPSAEELADLRRPVVGHGLGKRSHVVPFDVLVKDCEHGTRIGRSQSPLDRVHVLPGHRYSDSPTALRASSGSLWLMMRLIRPRCSSKTKPASESISTPLWPRALTRPITATRSWESWNSRGSIRNAAQSSSMSLTNCRTPWCPR